MRVKVFTAETMQDAMAKVKAELGIDAVILHSKRLHKGGFLGCMGKEVVEVTAAVDETPPVKLLPANAAPKAILTEPPQKIIESYIKQTASEPKVAADKPDPSIPVGKISRTESAEVPEGKTGMKEIPKESALERQQAGKIMQLQHELDAMKIMMEKVLHGDEDDQEKHKSLVDILREHEVQDAVAQEIIADIFDEEVLTNRNQAKTQEVLTQYFSRMFRSPQEIHVSSEDCKVVALIGATGVGKTTTLAKLAANFVLERGCSVALITADTYRISAVEQLKTYSDIIGLPLEIVYSPVELKAAVNKHKDKQLVLIDTAGRSQHNAFQIGELQEMLAADSAIETHLVLSATTKYRDAVDIIREFSICKPSSVLFTKLDETSSIGIIVNLIHRYPILLSYFTNGQSVPDDICLADAKKISERLLR